MVDTLSLGGGIVYLKDVYSVGSYNDLGFCPKFELLVNVSQSFKDEYFSDASGNLIRLPSAEGSINGILVNGTFNCESLSRKLMQQIWFSGDITDAGTELIGSNLITPIVRGLKFISVSQSGPECCLTLPAVNLNAVTAVPLIDYAWKNVPFSFDVVYADNIRTVPTLRIQEEGETLSDFCT